ncbi:MAG TPA: condensation domain-containing protein, partial [Candidatus Binatia bacterium]|nr:condensation domain-containing protein [Candidatus Binatia bacterium]
MSDDPLKSRNPAKLQAAKRELLSLLLEKERIESHGSKRVEPRLNRNNTPLSFGQERLWFLDQLDPGNSVYNICRAQRLKGPLDTAALERSLHEIVRHHEILRTIFPAVDGRPVQIVKPILTLRLPLFDLQQVISTSREAETTRIINEEARYAFNLSSGPLFRVALLRLAREEYVLVITAHQIVCDGWSMGLLFQGIERAYETITNGQPVLLRELSVQYGDYAEWQRNWLQG